jgi:arylsulfatase A-like enzyme
MRAVSLFFVFLIAKAAVLAGHTMPRSVWTPVAYIWQDALAALLFAAIDTALRRTHAKAWVAWWLYGALAIYAAVNIPVGRALSTPLTWPMLRAARGPLIDSFAVYVTWQNAFLIAITLGAAAILPRLRVPVPPRILVAAAVLVVAVGPMASARVDTRGLDRNVIEPLIAVDFSSRPVQAVGRDWRTSRFESGLRSDSQVDLSWLSGLAKGRNVVLISLESTAAQYLKLFGGEYDLTPNLSALTHNALVFENAYSVYPESIKGLFSILCSADPGFHSDAETYGQIACPSLPATLQAAGYRTALFHSGRFAYLGMEAVVRNRGYQTLEDAGDIGGNHESSFGVDEPAAVARIFSWLDSLPHGQRFFLTYLPIVGHHPYETPERGPFPDRNEIGRYRNALLYGDASLGTLIAGIKARGLENDTLWVILGDHGEAFGQHEGDFGHTFFLYEENVHVPLVIAAPGLTHSQTRVPNVASLVDIAPSVLDLVGIALPAAYRGHSVLDPSPRMALFYADYSLAMLGLRDRQWKYIYEADSGRSWLYDLSRDPSERQDISASQTERAAWYKQTVNAWIGRVH